MGVLIRSNVSIEGSGYLTADDAADAFGVKYRRDANRTGSEYQAGIVSQTAPDGTVTYAFTTPFAGDPGTTVVPWGPYIGALKTTYGSAVAGYAHIHADQNKIFSVPDYNFMSSGHSPLYMHSQIGETRELTDEIVKKNVRDARIKGANQRLEYVRGMNGYEGECVRGCIK